jgi:hypothetical protein
MAAPRAGPRAQLAQLDRSETDEKQQQPEHHHPPADEEAIEPHEEPDRHPSDEQVHDDAAVAEVGCTVTAHRHRNLAGALVAAAGIELDLIVGRCIAAHALRAQLWDGKPALAPEQTEFRRAGRLENDGSLLHRSILFALAIVDPLMRPMPNGQTTPKASDESNAEV